MRELSTTLVEDCVRRLCLKAAIELPEDVLAALREAAGREPHPRGKRVLELLLENAEYSCSSGLPLCQDTGLAVVFIERGREVLFTGELLEDAVNAGVAKGYAEGYLRKSVVRNPLDRVNTGTNTPCMLHLSEVPGDKVKVTVAPKGGGSENKSKLWMLEPADGVEGIISAVRETVDKGGAAACPPLIVGVGLGGTAEQAGLLAKRALLRPVGSANPDPQLAELEARLLEEVNSLGIGPAGLGGDTTALSVTIEATGCHIASLPVMVNLNCHAARHASEVL